MFGNGSFRSSARAARFALVLSICVADGRADIVAVTFPPGGVPAKFERYAVELATGRTLFGEPKQDVAAHTVGGRVEWPAEERFELIVMDPGDPERVPYRWEKGERTRIDGGRVCGFPAGRAERISVCLEGETLGSLRQEFLRRSERAKELEDARKAAKRSGTDPARVLAQSTVQGRRFQDWLMRSGFQVAAARQRKDLEKLERTESECGLGVRVTRAVSSITMQETPERLLECAEAISKGEDVFHVQSSLHVRIVYLAEIGDSAIADGLDFAEQLVEDFRREHAGALFELSERDRIPERTFCEFWFGPDEGAKHERYFEEYYGRSWGEGPDGLERSRWNAVYEESARPPEYLTYSRRLLANSLRELLAHRLGHHLADLQYGAHGKPGSDPSKRPQAWLSEAVGYHLSIEHLGHNGIACTALPEPDKSTTAATGREEWPLGSRARYLDQALASTAGLDSLVLQKLVELDGDEVAKGWRLYEYLTRSHGPAGEEYLATLCDLALEPTSFLPELRAKTAALLESAGPETVFAELDDAWRSWEAAR